jgi:hypothetical protein
MPSPAPISSLSIFGKRVERLFYFGIVLLLLSFFELYFVSASIYGGKENPKNIERFIARFEPNIDKLWVLFSNPIPSSKEAITASQREIRVNATRKLLGLPSQINETKKTETYSDALNEVVRSAAREAELSQETVGQLVDVNKSPDALFADMRQKQQELLKKPVTVWGIEAPSTVPLLYGNAKYQIPISFIANALLCALAPLLIGWLGSLLMTRQRELLVLRELKDYRLAFPHVLNILPVIIYSIPAFNAARAISGKRAKQQGQGRFYNRIFIAFFDRSYCSFSPYQ